MRTTSELEGAAEETKRLSTKLEVIESILLCDDKLIINILPHENIVTIQTFRNLVGRV